MTLLIISFIAGVLTVLTPCVLPVLPVIIGGSIAGERDRMKPYFIILSLSVSIIVFTLILKWSSVFIDIPQRYWNSISGIIIIAFGLISLFPQVWEKFSARFALGARANRMLSASAKKKTRGGDLVMGAALGPVFSSCSPTYFLILATVLPERFSLGLAYLLAYTLGLAIMLFLIAVLGQRFVRKVAWAADPRGWFKRGLGVLFIVVGVLIITGINTKLEVYLLENSVIDITQFEVRLLEQAK